jgi:hypothetical protein
MAVWGTIPARTSSISIADRSAPGSLSSPVLGEGIHSIVTS